MSSAIAPSCGHLANIVKAKRPNDTANCPIYSVRMTKLPIRTRVLAHLEESGITVAELSRRTGVSYDVLNKFKHRETASTGLENGRKLEQYLDALDGAELSDGEKRAVVTRLVVGLPEEALDEALAMLRYLQSKAGEAQDR